MNKLSSILFLLTVFTLTSCFYKNNKILISFDRVDGLMEGSFVYNKGVKIGEVTQLDLFGNRVLVGIKLKNNIKIPEQSTFVITDNLLGNSCVDIEYSNSNNFLKSNDTTYGKYQRQAIMDNIISDTTKRKNIEKSLEKIAIGIGELIESTKDTIKK